MAVPISVSLSDAIVPGPIVRLGPNEVSVSDFDVHNSVLYCQAPKFLKVGPPLRHTENS